jgi:hypothetical protein
MRVEGKRWKKSWGQQYPMEAIISRMVGERI